LPFGHEVLPPSERDIPSDGSLNGWGQAIVTEKRREAIYGILPFSFVELQDNKITKFVSRPERAGKGRLK
jgi:hypothetical protein